MFSIVQGISTDLTTGPSNYSFKAFSDEASLRIIRSDVWIKESKRADSYWKPILIDEVDDE